MILESGLKCDLDLAFKGSRTYLHGTDFFNEVSILVKKLIGDQAWLSQIRFRGFATKKCSLVFGPIKTDLCGNVCGEVICQFDGTAYKGWIVEGGDNVCSKKEYDESLIVGIISKNQKKIDQVESTAFSPIENIVALTKKLHYQAYPIEEGQWVFSQLDLCSSLSDAATVCSIEILKTIPNRFTVSEVVCNGNVIGQIRFSVAV
jgi:hypothetical protein